jgi:MFS transporter, DHA3 family, macrolide efflux protein
MLAVPWYFTGVVHEPQLFQRIYLVITFISLLWGLFAGTLVDRYSRRTIFLWINTVGFIVLASAAISGFFLESYAWILVAIVYATTVFIYNIHFPALYAFAQEITHKDQYSKVTSQLEIQGQLTWTLAGAVAALLLSGSQAGGIISGLFPDKFHFNAWPIYHIFLIDAITYVFAFVMIYNISIAGNAEKILDTAGIKERLEKGFQYLRDLPVIFVFGNASLLVFLCILIQGTLTNPIYVDQFLHAGGDVYALSDMVFSAGALFAGFSAVRVFGDKKSISVIIGLMFLAAIMFTVQIWNKNLIIFLATFLVIGFCNSAVRIQRVTFMFRTIPNYIIGRTGSIFFMTNVIFRMGLSLLFSIPFFYKGEQISYTSGVFGLICFIGAVVIWQIRRPLIRLINS